MPPSDVQQPQMVQRKETEAATEKGRQRRIVCHTRKVVNHRAHTQKWKREEEEDAQVMVKCEREEKVEGVRCDGGYRVERGGRKREYSAR